MSVADRVTRSPDPRTDEQLKDDVIAYERDRRELLEAYALVENIFIDFPAYRELPAEVQLALEVIKRHGAIYRTKYQELKGGQQSANQV